MQKFTNTLLVILLAFYALSCNNDIPDTKKGNTVSRTVLVYMIATNNLSNYSYDDITEMITGMAQVTTDGGNLLLYEVSYNSYPTLYAITGTNGTPEKQVIKTYPADIRSTTATRMAEVINDTRDYAPANSYGLVLWSHADGWVKAFEPEERTISRDTFKPLDFGIDYNEKMPITELAKALPDNMFDFIYADACYMGCIEIAYQLRNKTIYYISSPTETMATGMPYDENVPLFFEETINLVKVCQNTYNYYASRSSYATISLVDCSKLEPIAEICHKIHQKTNVTATTDGLQYYNRNSKPIFFDFLQYTKSLATQQEAEDLYNTTCNAVIYKAATTKFSSLTIDPDNYSGLSTYILGTSPTNEYYYTTLDWYDRVYN